MIASTVWSCLARRGLAILTLCSRIGELAEQGFYEEEPDVRIMSMMRNFRWDCISSVANGDLISHDWRRRVYEYTPYL